MHARTAVWQGVSTEGTDHIGGMLHIEEGVPHVDAAGQKGAARAAGFGAGGGGSGSKRATKKKGCK